MTLSLFLSIYIINIMFNNEATTDEKKHNE